jgi:hypothetical protein
MQNVQDMLDPVEAALAKDWSLDKKLYRMFNVKPDTPEFNEMWAGATKQEQGLYKMVRGALEYTWREMEATGLVAREHVAYLPNYGPIVYDFDSDASRGILPLEIQDLPVNGNIMFGHLKHRYGSDAEPIESLTTALKSYFVGAGKKIYREPAYQEMLKLSGNTTVKDEVSGKMVPEVQNFPEGGRKYIETWVRALKGHPATVESWVRNWMEQGGFGAKLGDAGATLATFISNQLYRGFLMGSPHFWLQNFVTQGILNPAAKHGPFRMMEGIARHADSAWAEHEPQGALLGSFNAIFQDLPVSSRGPAKEFMQKLLENKVSAQGVQNWRAFFNELESKVGVTRVEQQMRGIAFNIGMVKGLEPYENRIGRRILPSEIKQLPPSVQRRIFLEGYRTANDLNFQYGVYGSNPIQRQFFGGKAMGITFQFMTYYGKELGWMYRNSKDNGGRADPGLILRYFEILGGISHMMENVGIDPSEFNIVEDVAELQRRFVEFGEAPLGPVPSMISDLIVATSTEDAGEADKSWTSFFETSARATPAFQSAYKAVTNANQMLMGWKVDPETGELIRPVEDDETLALIFGTTSSKEAKSRRYHREMRRMDRARTGAIQSLARRYTIAWRTGDLDTMEEVVAQSKRFGLNPVNAIDSEINRFMYSALYRSIKNSDKNYLTKHYIEAIMRDFPQAFDERAAERYKQIINQRNRKLQKETQQ